MYLIELLESRTLLADTAGFGATASLLLEGRQSLHLQFNAPLATDPTLADIRLTDRATGQSSSNAISLNLAADRKSLTISPSAASFPDGDYQLTLDRSNFQNSAGDPLDFDL